MSLSKSKCWYSNNCLHFLKRAVSLILNFSNLVHLSLPATFTLVYCLREKLLNCKDWLLSLQANTRILGKGESDWQRQTHQLTMIQYQTHYLTVLITTVKSFREQFLHFGKGATERYSVRQGAHNMQFIVRFFKQERF